MAAALDRTVHATEALLVRAKRAFRQLYGSPEGRDVVSTDPFDQLRPVDPPPPTARFVARLRGRIQAALTDADLPVIDLPERTTTMTDTTPNDHRDHHAVPLRLAGDRGAGLVRRPLGAIETIRYTGDDGRIGHAEVTIEGATVMLSDEYPELDVVSPTTLGGTPTTLHLRVADVDAVHARVVGGGARVGRTAEGRGVRRAVVTMVDPFGHRWMIQTPTVNRRVEEIQEQVDRLHDHPSPTTDRHGRRRTASSAASARAVVPSLNVASSAGPMPWSPIAPWRNRAYTPSLITARRHDEKAT